MVEIKGNYQGWTLELVAQLVAMLGGAWVELLAMLGGPWCLGRFISAIGTVCGGI